MSEVTTAGTKKGSVFEDILEVLWAPATVFDRARGNGIGMYLLVLSGVLVAVLFATKGLIQPYIDANFDLTMQQAAAKGQAMPPEAIRLFGEQLTPVVSPWLLKSQSLQKVEDLSRFALIEAGDAHRSRYLEYLSWQRWLDTHLGGGKKAARFAPKRWLYFNYAQQIAQAALSGQGVALARLPLVAEHLASGDLVEPLPHTRIDSPLAYWLLVSPRSAQRPEIKAFCEWLLGQATQTRSAVGDEPDPETLVNAE
ncbi:MAG: hypothetical protein IBJ19_15930 [Gemmatimonadaceae bacterium]|nr:hypothetical protein [Gemmatimonadaceae bacterium]